MNFLSNVNKRMAKFIDLLLVITSFALVLLVAFQILNRFIIHVSAPWTEELARYSFVWLALVGSVKATRERQHIAVDIISALFETKVFTKIINIVAKLLSMFFFIILFIEGTKWCVSSGNRFLTTMDLKIMYIYAIIPFSFISMFIFEFENFMIDLKGWNKEGGNNH